MHSDQWQSYYLCQGQNPVYLRQDERQAWLTDRSRPQKIQQINLTPPFCPINSFLFWSVDTELNLKDCVCYVTLPASSVRLQHATHISTRETIQGNPDWIVTCLPALLPFLISFSMVSSACLSGFLLHWLSRTKGRVIVYVSLASCSAGDSQLERKTRLWSAGSHRLSSPAAKFTLTGEITASWRGTAPNREARSTRLLEFSLTGPTFARQLRGTR